MRYLVTAEEMKRADRNTTERIGVPGPVLMERAALAALSVVKKRLDLVPERERRVAILAGVGNNGADGLCLARLLAEQEIPVKVWVMGDAAKATEEFRVQRRTLEAYAVPVRDGFFSGEYNTVYSVWVDALFGVGLSRDITGELAAACDDWSGRPGFHLALDLPSGLNADTGRVMGCAIRADHTVTFGFCKRGLVLGEGPVYCGRVEVAPIGITGRAFFGETPGMWAYEESVGELLPTRAWDGNKSSFGKVLVAAGSLHMAGAAILAARAAYRTGAGMVKVLSVPENRVILQTALPEALCGTFAELEAACDWADAVVAGPGLGRTQEAAEVLEKLLRMPGAKPVLLDADALNLLAEREELQEALRERTRAGGAVVLTPHVGELSRLLLRPVKELKEALPEAGTELANRFGAVVVCKDARSFICQTGRAVCANLSGCDGMATAGSGDVLSGIIGSLLAAGEEPFLAAAKGACLHGRAGEAASGLHGRHGCMAGDICDCIGREI